MYTLRYRVRGLLPCANFGDIEVDRKTAARIQWGMAVHSGHCWYQPMAVCCSSTLMAEKGSMTGAKGTTHPTMKLAGSARRSMASMETSSGDGRTADGEVRRCSARQIGVIKAFE